MSIKAVKDLLPKRRTAVQSASVTGRRAAGEDPAKREQILDGAKIIFLKMGFDAASMNDVTRQAGVSKGTIYVYFQSKDDLFAALIERERTRFVNTVRDELKDRASVEEALFHFGVAFATHLTKNDVICSMRSVLGVIDRMPGLSRRFFSTEPTNARLVLREYFDRQIALGVMKTDDSDLAARQFIELSTGTFFKLRLFGELSDTPPRDEIEYVIRNAIQMFMAFYGTASPPPAP